MGRRLGPTAFRAWLLSDGYGVAAAAVVVVLVVAVVVVERKDSGGW